MMCSNALYVSNAINLSTLSKCIESGIESYPHNLSIHDMTYHQHCQWAATIALNIKGNTLELKWACARPTHGDIQNLLINSDKNVNRIDSLHTQL